MESHLIERLRNEETMRYAKIMDEAADRIKQLEAERDKLLAALVSVNESAVCFAKNEYAISADAIDKVENCISSAATANEQWL